MKDVRSYIKKPVEIEAIRFNGRNLVEVEAFMGDSFLGYRVVCDTAWEVGKGIPITEIDIKTLDSIAHATNGDYIIKGIRGEFYPCTAAVFVATYTAKELEDRSENENGN